MEKTRNETRLPAEEDVQLLASWNAWKEVCWVHGVGKPRGSEPAIGTPEDEARLVRFISAAFKRKREPYEANPMFAKAFSETDWAQVFDSALLEYEHADRYRKDHYGDSGSLLKKKAWKDHVWKAAAESDDPPCRVIAGKLLGQKGIINDIFDDWLEERFNAHFEDKADPATGKKKKVLIVPDSLDKPLAAPQGDACAFDGEQFVKTFEGYEDAPSVELAAESEVPGEKCDKVPESWKSDLEKAFSGRLCCLMLAHIHGVKIYNDTEILDALGVGSTTAALDLARIKPNYIPQKGRPPRIDVWEGIDPDCRDWLLNDAAGTRFFLDWIKERCRAEKAGRLILSRMEAATESTNRNNEE